MTEKQNVYKTYNKISTWFDDHRSHDLFEKDYLDMVTTSIKPNAKILDLGCGTGEPIAAYLIEQGFDVVGVDASEEMLKLAKQRLPKMRLIQADMRDLYLDKKFDCILAWHSFFHLPIPDQRKMFATFAEHIKPGGILMFTSGIEEGEVWSDNGGEQLYHASLSPDEYKALLKSNGFKIITYKLQDKNCGDATVWVTQYNETTK